jgi:serine/threonine protein phosphatase PrpC
MAVSRYELKPLDEMLLLCSDGVFESSAFGGVTEKVIEKARECVTMYGFETTPEELCSAAVESSCDDNVTAVLVRFCEIKPKAAPPRRPTFFNKKQ